MKKLISALYTAVLVLIIPAVFIAYLYNNDTCAAGTTENSKTKIEKNANFIETSFKPGLYFILKGV